MVVAAAMPPAADATSKTIPSRRLIRLRPAVPADTALDVAMTVTRLIAAATLKSMPRAAFRKGTRKTTPPIPSNEPRLPAAAPAAITIATTAGVTAGTRPRMLLDVRRPSGRLTFGETPLQVPALGRIRDQRKRRRVRCRGVGVTSHP